MVLITDASTFFALSIPGTVITVLLKGALAGLAAGLVYLLLEKVNLILAVAVAAIVCPVVNTGIFLLGCRVFFFDTINAWAAASGYESAGKYMIIALVGVNFLIEMAINIVLSPTIVKLISIGKGKRLNASK